MASKEHLAIFEGLKNTDASNKRCFECGAPNTTWCNALHAVYLCLDCSGWHRGLGTHLSFVRSVHMDSWQDERVAIMQKGGNARAKAWFESKGIPCFKSPQYDPAKKKDKWSTEAAFMYKDMLKAESVGAVFNPSTWAPPEWLSAPPRSSGVARMGSDKQVTRFGPGEDAAKGSRYGSMGSSAGAGAGAGASEWLSSGWAALATGAGSAVSSAVDAAAAVSTKASEINAAEAVSSGWGWVTSASKALADTTSSALEKLKLATEDVVGEGDLLHGLREGGLDKQPSRFEHLSSDAATSKPPAPWERVDATRSRASAPSEDAGWDDDGWGNDDNWDAPEAKPKADSDGVPAAVQSSVPSASLKSPTGMKLGGTKNNSLGATSRSKKD